MNINFLALFVAALSTLVVGFIWYNPKVFGTIWMKEAGITINPDDKPNMIIMFGMSILYAFLIAFTLQFMLIHQFSVAGIVGGNMNDESYKTFMTEEHKNAFRTLQHGALHGFITGLFFALPIIGVGALYEKRSWKYVLVSGGYWVFTCMIMGAIISAWQ